MTLEEFTNFASKNNNEKEISILSELRSGYSCFDAEERPYYDALSEGIKVLQLIGYLTDRPCSMNETEKAIRALELLKERKVVPVSEEKMNEFLEMAIKALQDKRHDRKKAKRFKNKYLKLKTSIAKIRAEVEEERKGYPPSADEYKTINKVLQIIDKYKTESEDKYADCD